MYFDIINAEYMEDYKIKLSFEDGSVGIADLSVYKDKENVFKLFLDKTYFSKFKVEYGTLVWGDGELDIAPETLYTIVTGKQVKYKENKKIA